VERLSKVLAQLSKTKRRQGHVAGRKPNDLQSYRPRFGIPANAPRFLQGNDNFSPVADWGGVGAVSGTIGAVDEFSSAQPATCKEFFGKTPAEERDLLVRHAPRAVAARERPHAIPSKLNGPSLIKLMTDASSIQD